MNIKEKKLLIILIILLFVVISITVYINYNNRCELMVNNKTCIMTTSKQQFEHYRPSYDIVEYKDENKDDEIQNIIANNINNYYDDYSIFIIIMNNDLIPYIAPKLSFILENLNKPIIIVNRNIKKPDIEYFTTFNVPDVMIYKNNNLYSAVNDKYKYYPYNMNTIVNNYNNMNTVDKNKKLNVLYTHNKNILSIKTFQNMDHNYILTRYNLNSDNKVDSIILDGKINITDPILKLLNTLSKKTIIINCNNYNNAILVDNGVIHSILPFNITLAKIHFLLSNVKEKIIIGKLFNISLRNE